MKPLAYGYMRVFCDVTEEQACSLERTIRQFADAQGFEFAMTFQETVSGSHEAFHELLHEVERADADYVVIPSFNHFSKNRILQNLMLAQLEEGAGVDVHLLRESERSHTAAALALGEPDKQPAAQGR